VPPAGLGKGMSAPGRVREGDESKGRELSG